MPEQEPLGFHVGTTAGWHTDARRPLARECDWVLEFSQGGITRQQAMRELGIEYSELLDRLSKRELPLPTVSEEDASRMAAMMVQLLA